MAASTNTTQSIDPDKMKASFKVFHWIMNQALPLRLEYWRSKRQCMTEKEKGRWLPSLFLLVDGNHPNCSLSLRGQSRTLFKLEGAGKTFRDPRGSQRDQGCAGDERAGSPPHSSPTNLVHLLQTLFTSCKPSYLLNLTHLLRTDEIFSKHLAYGHLNLGKFNYSARTNTKDYG